MILKRSGRLIVSRFANSPRLVDSLARSYFVWAISDEAKFLNGNFVWAQWDVEELRHVKNLKGNASLYTMGLIGYAD